MKTNFKKNGILSCVCLFIIYIISLIFTIYYSFNNFLVIFLCLTIFLIVFVLIIVIFNYSSYKKMEKEEENLKKELNEILKDSTIENLNQTNLQLVYLDYLKMYKLSSEELTKIINTTNQGIILTDGEGRIILVNSYLNSIFPYGKIGVKLNTFIDSKHILDGFNKCLIQEYKTQFEYAISNKTYIVSIYSINHDELISKSKNNFVGLFFTDITSRKELENTKRDFFANASHELKSPLTSISGYAQMLKEGFLDTKQEQDFALERILAETNRMNLIVKQMLSLSKYEFSNKIDNVKELSIKEKVIQFLNEFNIQIDKKNIQIQINGDDFKVNMNEDDLEYLIKNLVENAVKYNKENGKITIELDSKNKVFSISDTGIGISEYNQSRVFERFYRVDSSSNNKTNGNGLGLAIVKHIIQAYNFKIELHSKLNEGSTFNVFFN